MDRSETKTRLLKLIVELIDIPPSHYAKARDRYKSLAEWFHRDGSRIRDLDPGVSPQGSFALGTVIRALLAHEEYDLDLVCMLVVLKNQMTQKELKELVGLEVHDYADAHGIIEPVAERNRCWRLDYADGVKFHMDILPSAPEDADRIAQLVSLGAEPELARMAIAITDKRHPDYARISRDWLGSNPRGYLRWFQRRMWSVARSHVEGLVRAGLYASVEDVPVYEWKTPLQRVIQLLKRHRDVMFQADPELRPISAIITTLAAQAYDGEADLIEALTNIVDRMPNFLSPRAPRVRNPANPVEDFADKWANDPRLEQSFWDWHTQVKSDLDRLGEGGTLAELERLLKKSFGISVGDKQLREAAGSLWDRSTVRTSTPTIISPGPRPWGHA